VAAKDATPCDRQGAILHQTNDERGPWVFHLKLARYRYRYGRPNLSVWIPSVWQGVFVVHTYFREEN